MSCAGRDRARRNRQRTSFGALEESGEEAAESRGEAAEEAFENEIDRLEDELKAREDDYVTDAFAQVFSGDFMTAHSVVRRDGQLRRML